MATQVRRTLTLLILSTACVERPLSSLMPKMPKVLQTGGPARAFTWLGACGGMSSKPTVFLSVASWVKDLCRKKRSQATQRLAETEGKKVTGICPRLACSAGYLERLGEAVADALADRLCSLRAAASLCVSTPLSYPHLKSSHAVPCHRIGTGTVSMLQRECVSRPQAKPCCTVS